MLGRKKRNVHQEGVSKGRADSLKTSLSPLRHSPEAIPCVLNLKSEGPSQNLATGCMAWVELPSISGLWFYLSV